MTATVERIIKEIENLAPEEATELFRELHVAPVATPNAETEEASVEAEWDAEIDSRVAEIQQGKVELVSGADFHRCTQALFAELGLNRRS